MGFSDFDITKPIDNLDVFRHALNKAKISKQGWLELNEEIFDHLLDDRDRSSPVHDYEGIRLYREGMRHIVEEREEMNAEELYELVAKEKKAAKLEKGKA